VNAEIRASKVQDRVDAREDYILSLEKENDWLREELKGAKFNNEK